MLKPTISRLFRILTGNDADESVSETGISRLEKFAHFWVLVGKSFVRNRCPVRASALSYSTLLALIPMLAVAMSVTSSLLKTQGEEQINKAVEQMVAYLMPPAVETASDQDYFETIFGDPDNAAVAGADDGRVMNAQKTAAHKINDFIQNTRSGTLGITGMVLLVLVAIRMLANIEATFNDIWGVTRGRNWFARVVQYWAVITLGPLLLIAALGLAGGPHLQATKSVIVEMPFIGSFIFQLLPLFVMWLTFALFYQLVPNTKVKFGAAFVGGMVGGSLWYLNNAFGFLFVSRVATNSKFYGSLGLVPVFMMGLYFSWLILLFGAQVAYAFQNRAAYLQDRLVENVNQRGREFIALRLMTSIGQRFKLGQPAATLQQISAELGAPSRLLQQVLRPLIAARLVTETAGREPAFSPARSLNDINCHQILRALRAANGQELTTRDEPVRTEVFGEFARIEEAEKQAAESVTLLALVHRVQARLELVPATPETELKLAAATVAQSEPSPVPEGELVAEEAVEPRGKTVSPADDLNFPL
jgi:membrane protein